MGWHPHQLARRKVYWEALKHPSLMSGSWIGYNFGDICFLLVSYGWVLCALSCLRLEYGKMAFLSTSNFAKWNNMILATLERFTSFTSTYYNSSGQCCPCVCGLKIHSFIYLRLRSLYLLECSRTWGYDGTTPSWELVWFNQSIYNTL